MAQLFVRLKIKARSLYQQDNIVSRILWFSTLKKNNVEIKLREEEEAERDEEVESDEDKAMKEEAADNEPA